MIVHSFVGKKYLRLLSLICNRPYMSNINNIIQTSSENCLSFVVDENKSEKILETLHDTFIIQSSD